MCRCHSLRGLKSKYYSSLFKSVYINGIMPMIKRETSTTITPINAPHCYYFLSLPKKEGPLHFSLKLSTHSLSLSLYPHFLLLFISLLCIVLSQFSQSAPSILFNFYNYSLYTYTYIHIYFGNMITHRFLSYLVTLMMISASMEVTANSWVGSKYQIECTMCSACDNPCSVPSPPPPSPSPPPPPSLSPPPPSTPSAICPPPPSPPSSGYHYYSPPPPSRPSYTSPLPPSGVIGGLYPPTPLINYPTPPPPNPIVPYFPFYYYSPPPPVLSGSVKLTTCSVIYTTITLLSSFLFLL